MASAMFDWNDLKYFLAVARHGSTVGAAKALSVNRSTVHRRLGALEKKLGRQLFSREPTGYELTGLGQNMVAYAGHVDESARIFELRISTPLLRSLFGVKRTWLCATQTSADF